MKRLFIALLLPLMLGACVTSQGNVIPNVTTIRTPTTPVVVVTPTVIDTRIARASMHLARYCSLAQTVLSAGQFFLSDPSHVRLFGVVRQAVRSYCLEPPVDVLSTLGAMQRIWAEVSIARARYTNSTGQRIVVNRY